MARRIPSPSCNNPPNCPRFAEVGMDTVVFQGYVVDDEHRPLLARPPAGEAQVAMSREEAFAFARSLLSLEEHVPEVPGLLGGWERDLFRLEAQQQYLVDGEAEQIQAYLAGRPKPPWSEDVKRWRAHLRDSVRSGQRWQRVHVVDVPLTDYLRWELSEYPDLAEVGYDTLIADRTRHPELAALSEDFYLCDADEDNPFALLMRYDPEGRYLGMWRMDDPNVIAECRRRRDLALRYAEPLGDFLARINRDSAAA